mmetsp:Transcript_45043/g.101726  ORF Transcript_45043/g.101726 Transcript_45043/m.101726 type:complete len:160 (-) Transcript_45043:951-1430(-)
MSSTTMLMLKPRSHTISQQAGTIRKGGFLMIKGNPCKVIEVATFQPGKHGKTKCHFIGTHMFTGRKFEALITTGHNAAVPVVIRTEYVVVNVSADGFLALMETKVPYQTRSDLTLPAEKPDVSARIKALYAEEKEFSVIVLGACNQEMIMDTKVLSDGS